VAALICTSVEFTCKVFEFYTGVLVVCDMLAQDTKVCVFSFCAGDIFMLAEDQGFATIDYAMKQSACFVCG
jgi:hypothetical protein